MSTTRNHHSMCSHLPPAHVVEPAPSSRGEREASAASTWAELLQRFRVEADALRDDGGTPQGPAGIALAIVAEALDIGATITASAQQSDDYDVGEGCVHVKVTSAATDVDYHHLERRTRALRVALDGVDDYVWWGGLATAK